MQKTCSEKKNLDLHLHFVSTTGCIASYLYLYIFPYLYFIFIFIFFLYLVALFLIFIIVVAVGALYWSENPIETFQISGKYTKYYKYLAYTQNISNNRQIRSGLGSKSRLREKFTVRSGRDLDEVQDQRQGDKSWAKALARLALVSKKKVSQSPGNKWFLSHCHGWIFDWNVNSFFLFKGTVGSLLGRTWT